MNHPKMTLLSGFGKRQQVIFEIQSMRGFFVFEFSFQISFWKHFSTSGLSQIWKIRNAWNFLGPISRNTLIPCSEKTS
jgi:hypothetical protein